jgi:hypothetical protein
MPGPWRTDDEPLWRRLVAAWARLRPRPRSELVNTLRALDGQRVEIVGRPGRWSSLKHWRGTLDASFIPRGCVGVRYADGDDEAIMLSSIWRVVGPDGTTSGPF